MSNSDLVRARARSRSDAGRDAAPARWYAMVWRWHFYAGLFCLPFVVWLSLTGSLYLWRPQIESLIDRPYDHLTTQGPVAAPEAQVEAAVKAVPGSHLHKFILPETEDQATRILVTKDGVDQRVYIDPRSLAVLKIVREEGRFFRLIFHLHGELLAGAIGSYLVEVAACWTIVMLLTGLFLWWPRGAPRLGGLLYPRLFSGSRIFWRDLHATTGLWVSSLALLLILTGLPWAKGWGTYLNTIRQITGTSRGPVDWTIGGTAMGEDGMHGHAHGMAMGPTPALQPGELARVVATVRPLDIAPPVLISPPRRAGAPWSIASDAADRPLRSTLKVDGATGRVLQRTDFAQHHPIDRLVGYGVAVHEGMLFGLANQILGTVTAAFLVVLTVSGAVLWWRRRPEGRLGAPEARPLPRLGFGLLAFIVCLALYLPLFGITLIAMLLVERALLVRIGPLRDWLGLRWQGL